MLQVLDNRLRNKQYRFFKLIVTQVTHPNKTSVRLVGVQLHEKAAPWISVPSGAMEDDPDAKPDEDVTLKLLQPQEVVVRSYVISAESLMPKDDDGLADQHPGVSVSFYGNSHILRCPRAPLTGKIEKFQKTQIQ